MKIRPKTKDRRLKTVRGSKKSTVSGLRSMVLKNGINESPLFWPAKLKGDTLWVLDETQLPFRLHYIPVKNTPQAVNVIRRMKTRAFGQFLVVLNTFLLVLRGFHEKTTGFKSRFKKKLFHQLQKTAQALNASRPTFPFSEVTDIVIHWARKAIEQDFPMSSFLEKNIQGFLENIRQQRLKRVERIAQIIQDGDRILTHCNVSGELAMATRLCQKEKKRVVFFATETRPYFQGSKLTCWELKNAGAHVTLVADNAVGSLMMDGLIDRVIVGSDRSCANGDIANKIGTYQIAVLAEEFGVPLYALTQPSKRIAKGEDIPLELRDPRELLWYGRQKIVPGNSKGFYPGFDVVPHELIEKEIALE